MGAVGKEKIVDHINRNKLDNRKENLRIVTPSQNSQNKVGRTTGSSKFKGVYKHKHRSSWSAYITLNQKRMRLGTFHDEIEAAKAYNQKAAELFGDYCLLNTFD